MVVRSTYAFTLVLLCFLLGIGLGSALVARRSASPADTAASAAFAQVSPPPAAMIAFFSALPAYVLLVADPGLDAGARLGHGGAVAAVV
jgi:hypothetical protein